MELIIPAMFRLFERWLIVIEAMIIVYLGYKLFVLGVETTQTKLGTKLGFIELVVQGTAPGLFFMVLGSIILLACLYTGQIELDYCLSRIKESGPDIKNVSPEVLKDGEYRVIWKIQISHLKWLLFVSHLLLYCAITVSFALLFVITYAKQRKMLSGLSERLKANGKAITNIKKVIDERERQAAADDPPPIPIVARSQPRKKNAVEALRRTEAEERLKAEAQTRTEAEEKAKAYADAIAEAEERAKNGLGPIEIREIPAETATCECCGRKNIPGNQLVKIDSGELFCPDCLNKLRSSR